MKEKKVKEKKNTNAPKNTRSRKTSPGLSIKEEPEMRRPKKVKPLEEEIINDFPVITPPCQEEICNVNKRVCDDSLWCKVSCFFKKLFN